MSLFSKKQKNNVPQKSWQRKGASAYSGASVKGKVKRRGAFSRFLFWILLFAFFGISAYLLLFSTFLDINRIAIEGNRDISSEEIAKAIDSSLDGKIWKFLPRKNYFFVNKKNIDVALKGNFNRLVVASVEKKFPNSLTLKVTERKAELAWCSAGVCYFIDKSGLAYEGAAETEQELQAGNFLVVVDDSARPIEIEKTKIDPDYISYIEAVNAMVQDDLRMSSSKEVYHTPGIASKEISVMTKEGWFLKISSEYSIDEAKKVIQTLFEKDLNEEKRKKLEYLDMRIKNKVYYKIKPEEKNESLEEGDEIKLKSTET